MHHQRLVFQVLFVPYALHDRDHYADVARQAFVEMGFELDSIHQHGAGARQAVKEAQSIFIGGGNTFRLLKTLYDNDLVGKLKKHTRIMIYKKRFIRNLVEFWEFCCSNSDVTRFLY